MTKKPTGIVILAVFIAWGILNMISKFFLGSDSSDMMILNHYQLAWVGRLLTFLLLPLSIAALFSVVTKKKWGVKVLYTLFVLNVIFTVFILLLSLFDTTVVRDAYLQSRINRGLSSNNEMINIMTAPAGIIGTILVYFGFYSYLGYYVHKKRDYFSR